MELKQIPLKDLRLGENNMRQAESDKELQTSIKSYGVIQPLIVTKKEKTKNVYEVLAGGRRLHACSKVFEPTQEIPCVVVEEANIEVSLAENFGREAVSFAQMWRACKRMIAEGFTPVQIANRLGLEQKRVKKWFSIATVPEEYWTLPEHKLNRIVGIPEDSIKEALSILENYSLGHNEQTKRINALKGWEVPMKRAIFDKKLMPKENIETDLFGHQDESWCKDRELFVKLQGEAVEELRAKLAKEWKTASVLHTTRHEFGQAPGVHFLNRLYYGDEEKPSTPYRSDGTPYSKDECHAVIFYDQVTQDVHVEKWVYFDEAEMTAETATESANEAIEKLKEGADKTAYDRASDRQLEDLRELFKQDIEQVILKDETLALAMTVYSLCTHHYGTEGWPIHDDAYGADRERIGAVRDKYVTKGARLHDFYKLGRPKLVKFLTELVAVRTQTKWFTPKKHGDIHDGRSFFDQMNEFIDLDVSDWRMGEAYWERCTKAQLMRAGDDFGLALSHTHNKTEMVGFVASHTMSVEDPDKVWWPENFNLRTWSEQMSEQESSSTEDVPEGEAA